MWGLPANVFFVLILWKPIVFSTYISVTGVFNGRGVGTRGLGGSVVGVNKLEIKYKIKQRSKENRLRSKWNSRDDRRATASRDCRIVCNASSRIFVMTGNVGGLCVR